MTKMAGKLEDRKFSDSPSVSKIPEKYPLILRSIQLSIDSSWTDKITLCNDVYYSECMGATKAQPYFV